MKKVKIETLKKYSRLISVLLAFLGFSAACKDRFSAMEYGTPNANFIVKGNVTSANTSATIPNIRVVMGYDTTYTDMSGNYQVKNNVFPGDQALLLQFKDVDGAVNRSVQPIDTIIEFKNPQYSGGSGSWYKGEVNKEVNVKLKDK